MAIRYLDVGVVRRYKGKVCLLRVDLNIEPGQVLDTFRLDAVLPTIRLLLKHRVKMVLMSHRGRPAPLPAPTRRRRGEKLREGGPKGNDLTFSLQPFGDLLSEKLGVPVTFIPHFNFSVVKRQLQWSSRKVFLLENLRFLPGEEENDSFLARQLAGLGDFYVNDAFAVSHRKNASVVAITKFLPSYGGLCLERELSSLDYVMKKPRRPFTLILGGAKVGDKLPVLEHFIKRTDRILLGSGPACTFFAAQGLPVGHSIVDRNSIPIVKKLMKSKKIMVPSDVNMVEHKILDIGPKAIGEFSDVIKRSCTILWNGPMGLFEQSAFAAGTREIWRAVLELAEEHRNARIVIGGGETLTSLAALMPADYKRITADTYQRKSASNISVNPRLFLSTGGGAMLEYLSGKKLPGIACLAEARSGGGRP